MGGNVTWLRAAAALVALGLVGVIYNGWATADEDRQGQRWIEEIEPIGLIGRTDAGDVAGATLDRDTGRLEHLTVTLRLRCTPSRGRATALYDWLRARGPRERDTGGVLALRQTIPHTRLSGGLRGTSVVTVDARFDARGLTGAASTRVTLSDGAVCRADDVPLKLAPAR